jgi:hypothetical protein
MNTQMKTLMYQRIFNSSICRILIATCLSALCLIALSTQAATITVTNTNDSGAGSLRQAIADANDGDTVEFGVTGMITLITSELLVDKSITLSGPGATNLSVDGNGSSRVFHINSGKTATISGLTIANGASDNGGGIFNEHADLTLSNCTVSGNSASLSGGGVYSHGGVRSATLTLNNSTITGNSASSFGGGINNHLATLTANNSTISGNSALFGGGIDSDGLLGSATVTSNNSTISGNSATGGGGIYSHLSTLMLNNSTVSGNAATDGGGIINDSGVVTIGNTILETGISGQNIINFGNLTSDGYNLSDDDGGGYLTATGDQINTDPMLGPLQDNGGPTFTHALLTGSPAIDAGDPHFVPPPDYDQRGPGYVRVAHGRVDIGAFEVQIVTPSYTGQVQPPINADGTSAFNVRRGVVPVRFTLTLSGVATCDLPPATIAVTRTAGGVIGEVNESVYGGNADTGSNFRIDNCQYVYNLNSRALGVGTYRIDILIDGQVVGNAVFSLN